MLAKRFKLAVCYWIKLLWVCMNGRRSMCNVCWVLHDICNIAMLASVRICNSYDFYLVLLMQWALSIGQTCPYLHCIIVLQRVGKFFKKGGICSEQASPPKQKTAVGQLHSVKISARHSKCMALSGMSFGAQVSFDFSLAVYRQAKRSVRFLNAECGSREKKKA